MSNRLVKQAVTTYTPAVQEVIAQPARCVVSEMRELVTLFRYKQVDLGGYWYWWTEPYTQWVTRSSVQCFPAVEGVEGRDQTIVVDNQPGWNAGARSLVSLSGDLVAKFTPAAGSVGVLCGLAPAGAAVGSFNAIQHGVLLTSGSNPRIVQNGVVVATAPAPLPPGTEIVVARSGRKVSYQIGTWAYESTLDSTGSKAMYAVLYVAGDAVDDPSLTTSVGMKARGTWGWSSPAEANALKAVGTWGWGGVVTLGDGRMTDSFGLSLVAADYDYGSASLDLGAVELTAAAGFVDVEASGVATALPLSMVATAIDIDYGQMSDDVPLSMIAADYDYGSAHLDLGGMESFGIDTIDPEGTGSSSEGLAVIDTYTFDPVMYAAVNEGIEVGDAFDVVLAMDGQYADFLGLTDQSTGTQVLEALISAGVQFSDNASNVARVMLQYATNATTGAVARYQGFEFLGFQHTAGGTYAWKRDGLYRIGGDTDDGELLRAILDLAAEDFGTAERKRLDNVFLGLSTDGQVFVRMTDDRNNDVTYRAVQRGSEYRSNMQRGLSSRFWRMRLELVDASYADLDNVEWITGATGRRTTR